MDPGARSRPHRPRSGRRRALLWSAAVAAVVLVGLVVFVLVWFQPQKLFIDDRVVEAVPTVAPPVPAPPTESGSTTTSTPSTSTQPLAEPIDRARGEFVSLDHGTAGTARVIELADGTRYLRIEGLDTSNGPDLFVYLTANPAAGEEGAFDDDYVNLGRLKGNQGDQNYELPVGSDLRHHMTVVIWCDRFDSAFGAADLVAT